MEWKLIASFSMSLWWSGYSFLLSVCPCQIGGWAACPSGPLNWTDDWMNLWQAGRQAYRQGDPRRAFWAGWLALPANLRECAQGPQSLCHQEEN